MTTNVTFESTVLQGGNLLPLSSLEPQRHTVTPAASDTTGIHAAITCPATGTTTVTTAITNPDTARAVSVTGNQATVAGNVVIVGTDAQGKALTSTIVANGTATVEGVKTFKTISSITVPARGAASDAISIGLGKGLPLPLHLLDDTVLRVTNNYASVNYTVSVANNTVTPATVDGNPISIYWLSW
jgi:hypothetical protein